MSKAAAALGTAQEFSSTERVTTTFETVAAEAESVKAHHKIQVPARIANRTIGNSGAILYNAIEVADYHEIAPSPRLARQVECFWSLRPSYPAQPHRVLPDGCTDLIFWVIGGQLKGSAVGAMTRSIVTRLAPQAEIFGVRFHPGMSHGLMRVPVSILTDEIVDLESLWGKDGRAMEQRLADAGSLQKRAALIEAGLDPQSGETPVQRAALWIVANRGDASADELARHAGLSARQFRRLCIEQTGVGPKMLCRVLRFRNAANRIASAGPGNWADFALDHGYYDQAHFINEFREFSGVTPAEYASVFSNPQPPGPA